MTSRRCRGADSCTSIATAGEVRHSLVCPSGRRIRKRGGGVTKCEVPREVRGLRFIETTGRRASPARR